MSLVILAMAKARISNYKQSMKKSLRNSYNSKRLFCLYILTFFEAGNTIKAKML